MIPAVGTGFLVSDFLNLIAFRYLSTVYSFCFVLHNGIDEEFSGNRFSSSFISINLESVTESIQMANLERGCQTYVLSENSAVEFLDSYQYLQDFTNQRFPNKAFVIVMKDGAAEDQLQIILDRHIMQDIPRLLIIRPFYGNSYIELWTNKFTGKDGHRNLMFLDTYFMENSSFQFDEDLFPDKIDDLEGRFVRLALINYEPYTTWAEVTESKANAYVGSDKKLLVDGTETRVLLEFCRIHNCSLDVSTEEAAQWGEVYENHTGPGIMGGIAGHRVDVGIGAMLAWFYESNSPSQSLSRTGVTCITPKQKLLPAWLTPILPFSTIVWLALFVTIITITIILLILNHVAVNVIQKTEHLMDICEIFISVGLSLLLGSIQRIEQYRLSSQLTIVVILLFAGLLIGNTYCGGLSSIMTIPQYEKPIDTPSNLAQRNLIWGASHDAWVYAFEGSDEPLIIKLTTQFRTMTKTDLHDHAKRADMAYAIERLPYGHYGISDYIAMDVAHNFQVMLEDLYWGHCVIQVTKTWPMLEHLNRLIMQIFQSGMQRYWEEQVLAHFPEAYNVQKIIGLARIHDNPGAIALQVHHLQGPFFLLMFGLTGATLVFALEMFWFSIRSKVKLNNENRNQFGKY